MHEKHSALPVRRFEYRLSTAVVNLVQISEDRVSPRILYKLHKSRVILKKFLASLFDGSTRIWAKTGSMGWLQRIRTFIYLIVIELSTFAFPLGISFPVQKNFTIWQFEAEDLFHLQFDVSNNFRVARTICL